MKETAGCYSAGKFLMREKTLFTESGGLGCEKVNCLVLDGDMRLIAGTDCGLYTVKNGRVSPLFAGRLKSSIGCLALLGDGTVAAGSGKSVYYIKSGKLKCMRSFDENVLGITEARGYVWILTEDLLVCSDYALQNDVTYNHLEGGRGICFAVDDDNMYVATEGFLSLIHGKRNEWKNIVPRFSSRPEGEVLSLAFDANGYLWMGTENGSIIYDTGSTWLDRSKINALPANPVYRTVFDSDGGTYFATDAGIAYLKNGALKYFSADRWVPCNKINDIAVTPDGSIIYAATDSGISAIKSYYSTLSEKAAKFEDIVEKYHIRRGFTAGRKMKNYNPDDGRVCITDNDGLWTACYIAAESFRYAATGSKEALERARRGMKSMLLLTKVTGIPGFTARAVRYKGEPGFGDGFREWHLSPDGKCEWKGETSSDEMTGHFFGFSIYYDLCADEKEKREIRKALCGIMDHIIANNYHLVDVDGKPTTWACWDPEALNHDERWHYERGINSLELLGFLKACIHISGDEKYKKVYGDFIKRYRYPLNAAHHKVKDAHVCHIDDNLAFLASLTLLRLEENEAIRSLILCGMEDHWRYEMPERQPMFCVIHAAMTGRDGDIGACMASLKEIPLDLVHYRMENSLRRDLEWDEEQAEWYERPQLKNALPYDERNVHRPDGTSFNADERAGGMQDPTVFLLPYWAGRYFGIIAED